MRKHKIYRSFMIAGAPVRRHPIGGIAISTILILGLTACGSSGSETQKSGSTDKGLQKVNLGISTSVMASTFDQLAVAQKLGYFKDAGIEVTPQFVGSSGVAVQTLAAGKVDIAMSTPGLALEARAKGQDIKLAYNWDIRPVQKFAVLSSSDITSAKQLKGKTIGVQKLTSGPTQLAKAALTKAGIDPESDVHFVAVGSGSAALGALQKHRVAALMLYDSLYASMVASAGAKLRFFVPSGISDLFASSFVVQDSLIADNPKIMKAFGLAWAKASVYSLANPKKAIRIMWKLYPNSKADKSDAKAMKVSMAQFNARLNSLYGSHPPKTQKWGHYPPSAVNHWISFAQKFGLIHKKLNPRDVYTNQFVPAYNKFDQKAIQDAAKSGK